MNASLSRTDNMGGESEAPAGLIPELVHSRGENKGITSFNEQGHMDLSMGLKGLLSSDNAALAMSAPHHSQSIVAYNAESSRSSNLAKRVQLKGSMNQLNSSSSNSQQGNTPNGPASSSIALNILPENSRSLTSPGAPTSFERTASRADNSPRQQPTHPSHTSIDTSRLQSPMVHRTASSSDVSTRIHRAAPSVGATGGSRGTTERPSGSSAGLNLPTSPSPALLSPGNNDPRAYSNSNLSISGSSMAARPAAPTVQRPYHRPEASQNQHVVSRQPSRQPIPQPRNPNPPMPRDSPRERRTGLAAICSCSRQ